MPIAGSQSPVNRSEVSIVAYLFLCASGLVWFNLFDSGVKRSHSEFFVHRSRFGIVGQRHPSWLKWVLMVSRLYVAKGISLATDCLLLKPIAIPSDAAHAYILHQTLGQRLCKTVDNGKCLKPQ